ncbi:MAG: M3 family oligoendopeptidase, partial [Nitrospinae bacterium]|nr:M3 family oligoendopeptidase [Nitrospinota bacterium]
SIGFSMDLESRKGKAPGGYQTTFEEARIPFIFTNAVGLYDDVNTLLHEGGHAFHTIACRHRDLPWYRHAPMEFSEVASMSMELVGGEFLDPFFADPASLERAAREKLEGVVSLFGWVATVDAFQSWLYTHPAHTEKERGDYWMALLDRFDTGVDYTGLPEGVRRHQWHRQLHIFEVPFYYIEYAIAQLGALQVWARYNENPRQALDDYLAALSLGGSVPPGALFAAAGIRFDFTEATLGGLMERVADKLGLHATEDE